MAYRSDESGRAEIYVAPFPGAGGKRQVSLAGGSFPRWRADGKELFYLDGGNRLVAAEIKIKAAEVEIGAVRPLFGPLQTPDGYPYDVSADGQRILAVVSNEQAASRTADAGAELDGGAEEVRFRTAKRRWELPNPGPESVWTLWTPNNWICTKPCVRIHLWQQSSAISKICLM